MTFLGDLHQHLRTFAVSLADRLLGLDESHPGWLQNTADLAVLGQGMLSGRVLYASAFGWTHSKRQCTDTSSPSLFFLNIYEEDAYTRTQTNEHGSMDVML